VLKDNLLDVRGSSSLCVKPEISCCPTGPARIASVCQLTVENLVARAGINTQAQPIRLIRANTRSTRGAAGRTGSRPETESTFSGRSIDGDSIGIAGL